MRRLTACLAGLLLLAGCGGTPPAQSAQPVDPTVLADKLLTWDGLFSDQLEAVDGEVGLGLYGLEEDDLSQSLFYLSGGATAEELAVLTAAEDDGAEAVAQACRTRVERQLEAVRQYQPDEVQKLENAVIRTQANQVILVVGADSKLAEQALDELLSTES